MKKTRVLVAMSGGVDSSIAAWLMKQEGYDVVGVFLKCWSDTKNKISGECQWREERKYAEEVAKKLGIPLVTLDFEKEYKKFVIDEMFKKYKQGITPNPDVDCNEKVKFPLLIKALKKFKANYLVTGHYARTKKSKNKFQLLRAKDETKDQSYFLYRLTQNELSKCIFPIGDYNKTEIRKLAEKLSFKNYNKKGTVGICFIGKIKLKDFLQKKIKPKKGKILDPDGEIIGEHDGIYYYTIGQRIGPRFGIELRKEKFDDKRQLSKWYIARKDAKTNILVAAPENHPLLFRKEIYIYDLHLINRESKIPSKVFSRIRQVGELIPSKISHETSKRGWGGKPSDKKNKKYKVTLNKPITGVSEGQAIVLYDGKVCLGGGVISF